ncbi:MAG: hypothetical protein ABIL16_06135 [candidate division WOR-3 bacterium]
MHHKIEVAYPWNTLPLFRIHKEKSIIEAIEQEVREEMEREKMEMERIKMKRLGRALFEYLFEEPVKKDIY